MNSRISVLQPQRTLNGEKSMNHVQKDIIDQKQRKDQEHLDMNSSVSIELLFNCFDMNTTVSVLQP
jgi:hypothetical protein